jgi:hypothetical protein
MLQLLFGFGYSESTRENVIEKCTIILRILQIQTFTAVVAGIR